MQEPNTATLSKDEELLDVLLNFVIVAASLARKINQALKIREGGDVNGKNERIGTGNQRPAQCRYHY